MRGTSYKQLVAVGRIFQFHPIESVVYILRRKSRRIYTHINIANGDSTSHFCGRIGYSGVVVFEDVVGDRN